MFCIQCGSKLPENARFCSQCGYQINQRNDNALDSQDNKVISQRNVLKCEMCSSNQIVKENGYYVCKSCGTQYSIDEAKKLLIEIDNASIRIDNSDKLENYVRLAIVEINANNGESALSYCDKALEIKHDYYRAWMARSLACALLSNSNAVISCVENSLSFCPIEKKEGVLSDLLDSIVNVYLYKFESYIDLQKVNDVKIVYEKLKSIDSITKGLSTVFDTFKIYGIKLKQATVDYIVDFYSRLYCYLEYLDRHVFPNFAVHYLFLTCYVYYTGDSLWSCLHWSSNNEDETRILDLMFSLLSFEKYHSEYVELYKKDEKLSDDYQEVLRLKEIVENAINDNE